MSLEKPASFVYPLKEKVHGMGKEFGGAVVPGACGAGVVAAGRTGSSGAEGDLLQVVSESGPSLRRRAPWHADCVKGRVQERGLGGQCGQHGVCLGDAGVGAR